MARALLRGPASTALGLAALTLSVAGVHTLRGSLNRRFEASRRVLDDANIPRPEVARALSLGHTEWVTDALWINATLYYGETLFAHLPARYITRYTDTMIALDPNFRRAYLWGASTLLYRTVAASPSDVHRAAGFMRQGLARYPTDPEMHLELGMHLAFEEVRYAAGEPQRRALLAEGGEHLRFAASAGVGPPWLPLTAATLLVGAGRERDAVLVLCDGITHADNAETFTLFETRLATLLRGHADENPLAAAFLDAARSRRRHHPWMPPMLHVFVGEPMLPR